MQHSTIPPDTDIGKVSLTVGDLARSVEFYTLSLGLIVFARDGETVRLGAGRNEFLALTEIPGARPYPRTTGMYHMAILVPSRLELARVIHHFAETNIPLGGAADHLVSEALYLADPDENGIEIYRDRPRSDRMESPETHAWDTSVSKWRMFRRLSRSTVMCSAFS